MRSRIPVVTRGLKIRLWAIIVLAVGYLICASLADFIPQYWERIGLRPTSRAILTVGLLVILLICLSGLALCEKMDSLIIREEVTGLFNEIYARQRLDEEFYRSKRYAHPLSLMMIALDNFRDLSGRYGHAAGDHLLRYFGQMISETVRPSDIAARFAGGEFLILLPETTAEESRRVAERLQKKISLHPFRIDSRTEEIQVTISVGMTSFPQFGRSPDELITLAERALDRAKKDDENKLAVFASS